MATALADQVLLEKLRETQTLPTPPVVLSQINSLLSDPDASAYQVAGILSEDASMSARVLRMANSAFYALPQPVSAVKQAVVVLGLATVRSMVLLAAVGDTFKLPPEENAFTDQFWRHSLAVATATRMLGSGAKTQGLAGREEGFTAGLLHDIGKMVVVACLPDERRILRAHPLYGQIADTTVEHEVLGMTHAEIGGYLCRQWNLPAALADAAAHHHDLEAPPTGGGSIIRAVHVADYLGHLMAKPPHTDVWLPEVDWPSASQFGMTPENAESFAARVREEFGRSETFLQLIGSRL